MKKDHSNFLDALPSGWAFDRLKDVVALRNEKTDEASAEEDYLELEDVESGTGRILSRRNTLEVESAVTLFKKGDVLFGKLRPYLEKYYQAEFDGKCTGEILAFKPERIASRFLFHCVASRWFIERCNALAYGAKMPRVSWEKQLSQFYIPLPPLPEQQRIAAFLDESCAAIDTAIAAKRQQLKILDSVLKSVISRAVTRGLSPASNSPIPDTHWFDGVPDKWRVTRLKSVVAQFVDYRGKTPEKTDDGIRLITARNIKSGAIDFSDSQEFIAEEDYIPWMVRGMPEKGDVLITTEAPMGETAQINDTRVALAQRIVLLKPLRHVMTGDFLKYYFLSLAGSAEIHRYATGSTALGIKARWLKTIRVIVPPIDHQIAVSHYLDQQRELITPLVKGLEAQIFHLSAYRKSLIHECVTGQRRVIEAQLKHAETYA